ncbi:MAG: N-acetylmuramoyl-L-alanine amidase [Mobiluncus sp.]|uniref:peptidoglycan recognition protein family protein n=1 Tax=Mobiluncus sp. TaxID=47293 RepID=UPI00258B0CE1|nr:peptidoglycan recognition family protein [Mobiluncus sp.]MCI6584477.1 N-acetylmuramoyl-L-alanine amidase [Mobiluncus sp.]
MKSPNYSNRHGAAIQFLVVHWWGLPDWHRDADPTRVIHHLCTPAGDKSVSAHAVVYPGGIEELVDPEYAAWHARSANRVSIGIECWPWDAKSPKHLVEATLENLAKQIAHYYQLYPHLAKERLHPHSEHVATQCPGDYYRARLDQIRARALEIYQNQETPKRKEPPKMICFQYPDGRCVKTDGIFYNYIGDPNHLQALIGAGVPLVSATPEQMEAWYLPAPNGLERVPGRVKDLKDMATDFPGMSDSLKRTSVLAKIQATMGIPSRQA